MTSASRWLNGIGVTLALSGFMVYAAAFIVGIFTPRVRQQPFKSLPLSFRIRMVGLGFVLLGALLEIAARL